MVEELRKRAGNSFFYVKGLGLRGTSTVWIRINDASMANGKMIALYGVNGIGKTTQSGSVSVSWLRSRLYQVGRVKYPVYDLEPDFPSLYRYLREQPFREAHPQSTEELQEHYAQNRRRYEPELLRRLASGEWIVAEDYTGTGIAWGLTRAADVEYSERINQGLYTPDCSILMHGQRFDTAIEKDHRNEVDGERIRICQNFHFLLAEYSEWERKPPIRAWIVWLRISRELVEKQLLRAGL